MSGAKLRLVALKIVDVGTDPINMVQAIQQGCFIYCHPLKKLEYKAVMLSGKGRVFHNLAR